jgi:hypothetical protein
MANPTVVTGQSVGARSRAVITNHAAQFALVTNVSYDSTKDESTITVDSLEAIDQPGNYSTTNPGLMEIIEGQADTDAGKTANIESISGTDIVVSGDVSAELSTDDVIAVMPPLSLELNTQGGHSVQVTPQKDDEMGLTEEVMSHETMIGYDVEGDIPIFTGIESPGVGRLLLAALGGYKHDGSGLHTYRLPLDDDGTFGENNELTLYSVEGNAVTRQVFFNQFITQLDLDVPRRGVSTLSATTQGSEAVREVGGTGKRYPTGAGNWDSEDFPVDRGKRHVARGALIQLGGAYGDTLDKTQMDQFFQEITVSWQFTPTDNAPLGSTARAKASQLDAMLEVTGTRKFEDSNLVDRFYGDGEPTPGDQTEDRLLIKVVNPNNPDRYLKIDIPQGTYTVKDIQRDREFEEQFTYQAHHTLNSDGTLDTSAPLFEIELDNNDATDYDSTV